MIGLKIFRRRLLVSMREQLPLLFGLSVLAAANTLLVFCALAWIFAYGLDERIAVHLNSGLMYKVVGILVLTSAASAIWALVSTRSTIGLLHKVTGVLRQALRGEWPEEKRVKFRDRDRGFGELESYLQAVVGRLGRKAPLPSEVAARLDRLEQDLLSEGFSREEAVGCIRQLREMVVKGESA